MISISKRIKKIASHIPPAISIIDVGCDHGYLIIESFLNHGIRYAQAIDNKEGPLKNAINNISNYDFYDSVKFTLCNGLENMEEDYECIVISGMGGILISDILLANISKIYNKKLILQPNRNSYDLRKFLFESGFTIIDEDVVFDDDKYYEIIVAEKSDKNPNYSYDDLYFGPINKIKKAESFLDKLKNDLNHLQSINYKNDEILNKIKKIEGFLK